MHERKRKKKVHSKHKHKLGHPCILVGLSRWLAVLISVGEDPMLNGEEQKKALVLRKRWH